ncbi:hypothetical protein DVK85_05925 [Flavobacterium arcticum]|uniref:Glycine zipper family protein n=1 Tax=Flavobacterium arcticum TaxID=1784713 RepID=A0A345HB38_9FLAO|nr:hypothetical protein [Flavobacterium arcticum]AXG73798.1 hypothetical protein DVK85_05925 [Flavobacterium arcticum]KAF2511750.1 hypothetical protein E0W72_05435 [Flavobacterium arcticum]
MSLDETSQLLNTLLSQTHKKTEQKVYTNFIGILSALKKKNLTENQLLLIQEKLSSLNLNAIPEKRRKYYSQKLHEFKTFLKNEFSFTTEKHYAEAGAALGISLGMSLGMVMGLIIGSAINPDLGVSIGMSTGMSLGIGVGVAIGMIYGKRKDDEAKKQGLVL